jgi:hypothetical protein
MSVCIMLLYVDDYSKFSIYLYAANFLSRTFTKCMRGIPFSFFFNFFKTWIIPYLIISFKSAFTSFARYVTSITRQGWMYNPSAYYMIQELNTPCNMLNL